VRKHPGVRRDTRRSKIRSDADFGNVYSARPPLASPTMWCPTPPLPLGAASLSLARRSHSHNRTKALDSIKAHNGTAMRSINHQAAPQVHPHMLHAIGR
jgi:hypothetical protein